MNETEKFEGESRENESTIQELVDACREVLGDDAEEIKKEYGDDLHGALGLAVTMLEVAGIKNPEQFLEKKGILK